MRTIWSGLRAKKRNETHSPRPTAWNHLYTHFTCNNGVFGDTLTVCLLPFGVRTVTATPLAAIVCCDVTMFIWTNFIDTWALGFTGLVCPNKTVRSDAFALKKSVVVTFVVLTALGAKNYFACLPHGGQNKMQTGIKEKSTHNVIK